MYNELYKKLSQFGQEHLLRFWEELNLAEQEHLAGQINGIDWESLDSLIKKYVLKKPEVDIPENLEPAPYYPLTPTTIGEKELYAKAAIEGKRIVSSGKVAAFTVAGGQGTRLGYDGPKGTYPITPVKGKSLFQYFAEKISRASQKYSTVIPWYIMASEMNYQDTVSFFEKNKYFGLGEKNVMFFRQGTMPAIDRNGKVLLETKSALCLSPDGHGGSLLALRKSGALADLEKRGIEYISYFQVDNPLVPIVDLLFIGLHSICRAEMSAIMLKKTGPYEKLGNFCTSNGKTMIIEYSDLPLNLAEKKNADGSLSFIAGSPAVHIINSEFVRRLTENSSISLPWHRADKKVPYTDKNGIRRIPEKENAVKLESFIFDALPLAEKVMLLEADRNKQFAPTKNKAGIDSVDSCRNMLMARDAEWLEIYGGVEIPRKIDGMLDCRIELSPKAFLDEDDVKNFKNKLEPKKIKEGAEVYYE